MKVRFACNNGANAFSKRVEEFDFEELRITRAEWEDMTDEERQQMAEEWAHNYIEIWYEEVDE